MKDFTEIAEEKIIYRGEYFFIIEDGFPVSPGHLLIISNEVKTDFFALSTEEKNALSFMIEKAKDIILSQYHPNAFNIGMNCGVEAGQTVFHFHCHVIPRYKGDMDNPRGGVRHVIPGKGSY